MRRVTWVFVVALIGVAIAACGSSSTGDSSSSRSTSGSSNSQVAAAKSFITAHGSAATGIGISPPLPKRPVTGKRIVYVQCAEVVCTQIADGLREASQVLGWKFSTITAGATPSAIQSTWNSVIQENPDGVAASATPKALFAKQLSKLASKGTPYVVNSVTDPVGNGVTAVVSGPGTYAERGQWMARWVTASTNGSGSAMFVGLSDYPIFVSEQNAFKQAYAQLCHGCGYNAMDISLTDLGTTGVPSSVVTAAQRIPGLKYIVAATGELTEGLLPQLRSAGLRQVKVISQAGLPANFENIAAGSAEVMDIPAATELIGWMMADALARHFEGVSLPQADYDVLPGFFLTKENVSNPSQPYAGPPGYQSAFEKLWHVS